MTEVLFYHLERAGLGAVLPALLGKTLERGWRALVRCGARDSVERLDEALWTYSDESFLPHGADDASKAGAPVFLTDDQAVETGAEIIFLVDNAACEAGALGAYKRCVTIFDGGDEAAVSAARAFWKDVKAAGHDATYWKQSAQGRWEKQA